MAPMPALLTAIITAFRICSAAAAATWACLQSCPERYRNWGGPTYISKGKILSAELRLYAAGRSQIRFVRVILLPAATLPAVWQGNFKREPLCKTPTTSAQLPQRAQSAVLPDEAMHRCKTATISEQLQKQTLLPKILPACWWADWEICQKRNCRIVSTQREIILRLDEIT